MMKRYLLVIFGFALLIAPGVLLAQAPSGMTVTCDDGTSFDNGVEIVVSQMRSGFNYTATAIGINGFDPVLAVLDTSTGNGLCSDDDTSARRYDVNLPTTGNVPASNLSAQIVFSQNITNTFADVSLVVGGYGNQSGEFVLILEGMAVTSGDGDGDMFKVNVTPGMVASGVPLSVYMITRGQSTVDPLHLRRRRQLQRPDRLERRILLLRRRGQFRLLLYAGGHQQFDNHHRLRDAVDVGKGRGADPRHQRFPARQQPGQQFDRLRDDQL